MIEGKFADVSLPGLLQFLASEPGKNYHVEVSSDGQVGEIFVCGGNVVSATFKLLEGEDALVEFLAWSTGEFGVDVVNPNFAIKQNLHLPIKLTTTFVEQTAYLVNEAVGLNTVIKQADEFGTTEWQKSLHLQPLEREDFVTLSWIGDGRSMRQAMREFNFDVVKATGILFRLLSTDSIKVLRPSSHAVQLTSKPSLDVDVDVSSLVGLYSNANGKRVEAISLSGGEGYADDQTEVDGELEITGGGVGAGIDDGAHQRLRWEPVRHSGFAVSADLAAEQADSEEEQPAVSIPAAIAPASAVEGASSALQSEAAQSVAAVQSGASATALESTPSPVSVAAITGAGVEIGTAPGTVAESSAGAAGASPAQSQAPSSLSALAAEKQQSRLKGADPARTHSLPALPKSPGASNSPNTVPPDKPVVNAPRPFMPARSSTQPSSEPSIKRTVVLPLVTLDIERLLQSTFTLTQVGKLALTNPALELGRRQALADVQAAKKVVTVLGENTRPAPDILCAYKYCLDHGYIESADPVIPLTAELLLGRIEIDQYLLQRRRLTGDELRDLLALTRSEGIRLPQLLVRSGYLTAGDLDTLSRELRRFSDGK